jgi:hypothetical protein
MGESSGVIKLLIIMPYVFVYSVFDVCGPVSVADEREALPRWQMPEVIDRPPASAEV